MAEEESFENLENLDWSDVESELKANKEKILSEVKNGNDTEQNGKKSDIESSKVDNKNSPAGDIDIDFLFDVQLSIVVEVGRVQMLIGDLLELNEESIIELDSVVGQPLDIRANDLLVARGDVIIVYEIFAVRITDIMSPDNRFDAL